MGVLMAVLTSFTSALFRGQRGCSSHRVMGANGSTAWAQKWPRIHSQSPDTELPKGFIGLELENIKKTKKIKLQHYYCLLIKLVQETTKEEGLQLPRKQEHQRGLPQECSHQCLSPKGGELELQLMLELRAVVWGIHCTHPTAAERQAFPAGWVLAWDPGTGFGSKWGTAYHNQSHPGALYKATSSFKNVGKKHWDGGTSGTGSQREHRSWHPTSSSSVGPHSLKPLFPLDNAMRFSPWKQMAFQQ